MMSNISLHFDIKLIELVRFTFNPSNQKNLLSRQLLRPVQTSQLHAVQNG